MSTFKQSAWLWYLAIVVGLGQYYFVSSVQSPPDGDLYTVIGATAVVAVIVGLVVHRPRALAGWMFVLAAIVLYLAGDYVYAELAESSVVVEVPSSADALYLAMYPVLAVGIALVARSVVARPRRGALLDAGVIGVAAFAVIGAIYLRDLLVDDRFGNDVRIVTSAYPLLDVVLVAVVAWAIARSLPAVAPTLWLLGAALGAMVVGNAVFNVAAASFSFEAGGVADLGWLTFTSLLGAAALHPSVAAVDDAAGAPATLPWWTRPVALGAAVAVIPVGHLVWGDTDDVAVTASALAIGVVAVVVVAVQARSSNTVQPNSSTSAERVVAATASLGARTLIEPPDPAKLA